MYSVVCSFKSGETRGTEDWEGGGKLCEKMGWNGNIELVDKESFTSFECFIADKVIVVSYL